ncbi:MAG: hypothetical protein IPG38_18225 [Chitinophagaceae bacterium]|nr:hypothetical protein [Chitinophagaceae bacterium]
MKSAKKISPVLKSLIPPNQIKKTGSETDTNNSFAPGENDDCETLINCTDDLLWTVNSEFKLIAANKAFYRHIEDSCIRIRPGDDILLKAFFRRILQLSGKLPKRALAGESFKEKLYAPAFQSGKHPGQKQILTRSLKTGELSVLPVFQGILPKKKQQKKK